MSAPVDFSKIGKPVDTDAPEDFSKIGKPVDKDAPEEVLQYLAARGWKLADIRTANLRLIDGEQVIEIWPGSTQGYRNPAYVGSFVIDPKTKNAFWPQYGLVLPDTQDRTYGTTCVFH